MWVFVADPPLIDNAIYAMWVDGLPGSQKDSPFSSLQLTHAWNMEFFFAKLND